MSWMLLCKGFSIVLPLGMRRDIIRLNTESDTQTGKRKVFYHLCMGTFNLICKWCWLYDVSHFLTRKGKAALWFIMWKQELLPFTPDRSPLEGLLFHCSIRHVIWDLWTMLLHTDSNVLSQSLLLFQYHKDYGVCY